MQLMAYVDWDWAMNTEKRTSMMGMVLMYGGGVIGYKSKFQSIMAHSSTEAEFIVMCDTAKMILFFRSLLHYIGIEQSDATILFDDNTEALLMANAQQPTCRTRHMDIKHFTLLDWVERDLLVLEAISTHDNAADAMTKTLTWQTFNRHSYTYMEVRIPDYCAGSQDIQHLHTLHQPLCHKCKTAATVKRMVKSRGGEGWTYV